VGEPKPENPPLFHTDDEQFVTRSSNGGITGAVPGLRTDVTLRDLFAGLIAAQATSRPVGVPMGTDPAEHVARMSYHFADALLRERSR
jgi:hypothetical protein